MHRLAHMCARFSPLKAPQGGSTVLKKIFPKALIRKTMVLVNSQSPLRHAHTHTHAHIPLHLNTILAAPLPSPPYLTPQVWQKKKKKNRKYKNKTKKILAEGEESVPLPGLGQGPIYLPQHCSFSLTAPSTSPRHRNLTLCLLLNHTRTYIHTHKPAQK